MESYHAHDFSSDSIDAITTVEALPFLCSFEQVMRDNQIVANTYYTSGRSIYLPEILVHSCTSPELKPFFYEQNTIIDAVTARLCTDKDELSTLEIAMTVNGVAHTLVSTDRQSTYTIAGYSDNHEYSLSPQAGTSLLGTLVYAAQYDIHHPDNPIELDAGSPAVNRDPKTAQIEQFLVTLGHLNGMASTSIQSVFDTADGPLYATLIEGEDPAKSYIQSKLELSFTYPADDAESLTTLSQNAVTLQHRLEHRFAEKADLCQLFCDSYVPDIIDPVDNPLEWAYACKVFLQYIQPHLEHYVDLDK